MFRIPFPSRTVSPISSSFVPVSVLQTYLELICRLQLSMTAVCEITRLSVPDFQYHCV